MPDSERAALLKPEIEYPRILIVTSSTFNHLTGTGLLLTNLFKGWPIEKISLLYSDNFRHDEDSCSRIYKLGPKEWKWRWPLSLLDRSKSGYGPVPGNGKGSYGGVTNKRLTAPAKRLKKIYDWCARVAGGEEVFLRIRMSDDLHRWVNEFSPDIIYSHISSLNNIQFNLDLQSTLGIPLCIHIMDDWLSVRYRQGLFASVLRRQYLDGFKRLLGRASLRMGIGPQMCKAYEQRFGYTFLPFYNALDIDEWMSRKTSKENTFNSFRVVYAGTINTKNVKNLATLSRVILRLNSTRIKIDFKIYTFNARVEVYKPILEKLPVVSVDEAPETDEGMGSLLMNADLLFLPVDFTKVSIERMRYSMFAKLPAYMVSGTPILAYGPPEVAAIDYAIKEKWAYVVSEEDESILETAVTKLLSDALFRERVGHTAQQIARRDFNANKMRRSFHETLAGAAAGISVTDRQTL